MDRAKLRSGEHTTSALILFANVRRFHPVFWLCGQVLTNKLLKDAPVADSSDRLPPSSYKILLGHLGPTQGIPKLFTELSSVRTASGELKKQRTSERELRFGDVFAHVKPRAPAGTPARYFLVVSQTCDLLQCKLENGQVLCIEG